MPSIVYRCLRCSHQWRHQFQATYDVAGKLIGYSASAVCLRCWHDYLAIIE